jgi:P4 family phage/plasmid primase-like protien
MENFIRRYSRRPDTTITHQILADNWRGPTNLHIPKHLYPEFWELYVQYLIQNSNLNGLNVFNERLSRGEAFRLFIDMDFPMECFDDFSLPGNKPEMIHFTTTFLNILDDVVRTTYGIADVVRHTAVRNWGKYHIVYPNIITSLALARNTRREFLLRVVNNQLLNSVSEDVWVKAYDAAPYTSGLRMLWSHKGRMSNEQVDAAHKVDYELIFGAGTYSKVYYPMDANWNRLPPSVQLLRDFSIHNYENLDVPENHVADDPIDVVMMEGLDNESVSEWVKGATRFLGIGFEGGIHRIEALNVSTIKITLVPQPCPFTGLQEGKFNADNVRMHRRTAERNTPCHYILVSAHGAVIKCHNQECADNIFDLIDPPVTIDEFLERTDKWYRLIRALTSHHEDVARFVFQEVKDKLRVIRRSQSGSYKWFLFEGHRWMESETIFLEMMQDDHIPALLSKYLVQVDTTLYGNDFNKQLLKKVSKLRDNLKNKPFSQHVSFLVGYKLENLCPNFGELLNSKGNLLVFNNGVIDFNEGSRLRPGRFDDYCSFTCKHDYLPWDEYPIHVREEIREYLNQVFTRPGVLEYVLWLFASTLFVSLHYQDVHFLQGVGGNGKSLLMEFMGAALGDFAADVSISMFTQSRASSNAPSPELMNLRGKRWVTTSEPDTADRLRVGLLKQLSGNDSITTRQLYENIVTFVLKCRFVLLCNDVPRIDTSGSDEGTWRRLHMIPFRSRFLEEPDVNDPDQFHINPATKEKIHGAWAPAFISMLVNIAFEENFRRPVIPPDIEEATMNLRRTNDHFGTFANVCLIVENGNVCTFQNLWMAFNEFCKRLLISVRDRGNQDRFRNQMISKYGAPEIVNNQESWSLLIQL